MPRLTGTGHGAFARPSSLRAGLVSVRCLLRSLPLFFRATPRTPLRVLCIVALDTIHRLRRSQPLSRQRRTQLATFLDFQAGTNAIWDRKHHCAADYQALQHRLEKAGLGVRVSEYLRRLGELESRRPSVGGDWCRFDEVRSYREAVVRLSLAAVMAIALNADGLEETMRATHCDPDVAALFRMAMQCQVIDDVLDYNADRSAGLPSFLTASPSLRRSMALTAEAARAYSETGDRSARAVFPLRTALSAMSAVTTLVVRVARRGEHGMPTARASTRS